MSKYIHLYNVDSEFEEDYMGEGYGEPWVSRTLENDEINYNKKETTYYMYWGRSGTATVKTLSNVESGTSSGDLEIRTNEPSISSVTPTVGWTTVTATTISVHYNISENTTSSARTGSVTITGPNGTSIVLNVTQVADTPYLVFSDTTATTKSLTFESGDTTTGVIGLSTNLTEVAVTKSGIVTATTINKSGSTVTGITASFATATTTSDTTGSITISSGGSALTVTITENGRAYFSFTNGNTAITYDAITASTITSAGTPGYTIPYYTNFKGLYINNLPDNPVLNSGMFDSISISNRDGDGNLVFVVSALSSGDASRNGEIKLYPASGNSGAAGLQSGVCGDITVNQSAGGSWYLYLGASGQTTAQTATLPSTGTVGTTEAFVTNYTAEKISSDLSTSADTWISNITLSTTGISFDVAERQADFASSARTGHIWVLGGASGTLTLTVNQAANPLYTISVDDASYTSDFTGNSWVKVTTNCPQEVLTALTVSATTMTDSSNLGIPVPANKFRKQNSTTETAVTSANCYVMLTTSSENTSTTTDRTNTIYIKSGSTVLAQSTVTHQKSSLYLYFNSNSGTSYAYPTEIDTASTNVEVSLYTNYSSSDWSSNITYSSSTWLSSFNYNASTHKITFTVSANPRGASSTTRTGRLWILGGVNGTLALTLVQKGNLMYLYMDSDSATTYTYPGTISSAANLYIISLYTNYTQAEWNNNITVSADTWLNSFSYNPTIGSFSFSANTNPPGSPRTGHIWIKGGVNGTLTVTITQEAKSLYLYIDSDSATTYTYPYTIKANPKDASDEGVCAPRTIGIELYTNYTNSDWADYITVSGNLENVMFSSYDYEDGILYIDVEPNATFSGRTGIVGVYGGINGTLYITFNQEGLYITVKGIKLSGNQRSTDASGTFPMYWHKVDTNLSDAQLASLTVSASTYMPTQSTMNNLLYPGYEYLTTNCGTTSTNVTADDCYVPFKFTTSGKENVSAYTQTIYVLSANTILASFEATLIGIYNTIHQYVFEDMHSSAKVFNVVAEATDTAATVDIVYNESIYNFTGGSSTYSGITTGSSGWCEYGTYYPNRVAVFFPSATTTDSETGICIFNSRLGGNITINVTRKGLPFKWSDNTTALTSTIGSAQTVINSGYVVDETLILSLSSNTPSVRLEGVDNKIYVTVPVNESEYSRIINVCVLEGCDSNVIGTWRIVQRGNVAPYIRAKDVKFAEGVRNYFYQGSSNALQMKKGLY